jgi:hypothetical protein
MKPANYLILGTALSLLFRRSDCVGGAKRADRAALVGAGMLSALLLPTFAGVLLSRVARIATQGANLT